MIEHNVVDGLRIINAEDWNEAALLILMNIIHGHTRRAPLAISMEALAKVAAIVDYYKYHEAVELFTDTWIDHLEVEPPLKKSSVDLIHWIFISEVFTEEGLFKRATRRAIQASSALLVATNLSIQHVLGIYFHYLTLPPFQN